MVWKDDWCGTNDLYLPFSERARRDAEVIGLRPFEFFVEGCAHFRRIGAGPCCFLVHAPGKGLGDANWGGWPEWLAEMARDAKGTE